MVYENQETFEVLLFLNKTAEGIVSRVYLYGNEIMSFKKFKRILGLFCVTRKTFLKNVKVKLAEGRSCEKNFLG